MDHDDVARSRPARSAALACVLCWVALLADGYDLYTYGATLVGFLGVPPWNATPATAGIVGSIALVGMLIGSLLVGSLTDHLGRRRLMIGCTALFSLAMLGCALAPTFTVFGVFRFLACLGAGGLLPTAVALVHEFAPAHRKSIVLGLALTGPVVGTLLSAVAAMLILPHHGVRPVYALGVVPILLVPVLVRYLPESPAYLAARAGAPAGAAGALVRTSRALFAPGFAVPTLGMWAMCFCSLLTMFGLTTWLPTMMQNAGASAAGAIGFLALYSLGGLVGTLVAAFVSERTAPKVMVSLGFAGAVAALVLVSARPRSAVMVVAVLIAGVGGMGTQNLINDHVARFYPGQIRATGLGWMLAVGRIGAIIAPTYGAWTIGTGGGIGNVAVAFGVPAAIGCLISLLLPRSARRPAPVEQDTAWRPVPGGGADRDRLL